MKRKSLFTRKHRHGKSRRKRDRQHLPLLQRRGFQVLLGLLLIFTGYVVYLDFEVRDKFSGKRWSLPAQVYARPLELYVGKPLSSKQLEYELVQGGYRYTTGELDSGNYTKNHSQYRIITHAFSFWDGHQPPRYIQVAIENDFVTELSDFRDQTEISVIRLEPMVVGRIYPAQKEDRLLVKLEEVPEEMLKALIAVEDRDFYQHFGINPKAILRAMWANLRAGSFVQGGSTLTQQLVKNFFLTQERSLWRKLNEVMMALLLEIHYEKNEILEAYLNEIYLGQDKKRAIHGFGLASRFYFDKPVYKLSLPEMATLVALVRGPSYYDPWKHKQRLLLRRNKVLDIMMQQGAISASQGALAQRAKLDVLQQRKVSNTDYPAFIDVLKSQLYRDYSPSDLTSEGLQIFTTFDPYIQQLVEETVERKVTQLDRQRNLAGRLQAAVIVTNTNNADILAVAGDKQSGYAGFNRALDANRPIGSLIKPAVYLTALQDAQHYNLSTPLEDSEITLRAEDGTLWSPRNYSGESHGVVPLYRALIHSYNQATVRLGLQLGFEAIEQTLHKLGVTKSIPPYPSMLLGAVSLSPYEVTQMYQTLASGGFIVPLRSIREVLTAEGKPLKRYSLEVEQAIDPSAVAILNSALQAVTRQGTARSLRYQLPETLSVAGKTGTTNDTRDSWFAGFSGEHLIVSWMGTDDNQPTGLTGSSGALKIWSGIMQRLTTRPLSFEESEQLEYHYIEPQQGMLVDAECASGSLLAYLKGTAPERFVACPPLND